MGLLLSCFCATDDPSAAVRFDGLGMWLWLNEHGGVVLEGGWSSVKNKCFGSVEREDCSLSKQRWEGGSPAVVSSKMGWPVLFVVH